jgi:hypothetical protein
MGALMGMAILSQETFAADRTDNEKAAVLAALEEMFDAMRQGDAGAFSALLVPEGMAIRVRIDGPGEDRVEFRSNAEAIARFKDRPARRDERIWDPIVLVHGPIAMVQARYDFYIDGKFSHCGVDQFEWLKIEGKWRLSNASWTVQKHGCPSNLARRSNIANR